MLISYAYTVYLIKVYSKATWIDYKEWKLYRQENSENCTAKKGIKLKFCTKCGNFY